MPERAATWDDLLAHEAQKARVPFALAKAVMDAESGGRPDAVSPKGAIGLMQLMPATAQGLGVDPRNPLQNLRGGVTYLRQMLDLHQGDVRKALTAYNAGPNAQGADQFPETQQYVDRILTRLSGGSTPAQAPIAALAGRKAPVSSLLQQKASQAVGTPPPGAIPDPTQFETRPAYTGGFEGSRLDPEVQAWDRRHGKTDPSSFDVRTPEGRRNVAGAAGSIALSATPQGRAVSLGVRTAQVLRPIVGAALGGMLEEGGEQLVGTRPPDPTAIASAGVEQGATEAAGAAMLWPVRAVGRRVVAAKVAKQAAAHLETALNAAQGAVRGAKVAGRRGVQAAKDQGGRLVESARQPYEALIGQAPSAAAAGRQAQAVINGPAKSARDLVGESVAEAAKTGPAVNIATLKAEAQRIIDQELAPAAIEFPREVAESVTAGIPAHALARMDPAARATIEEVESAQRAELIKHPAMGVLTRILNASDEVPFAAMHQFKRELDDALQGTGDQVIKKRVTAITQHLRGTLRGAMTGHAPYDQATAAYGVIAPLYTKGIAPQLKRLAVESPEAIVRLMKGNEPTKALMLKDLLTQQAAAGGDAASGQAAWDAVRGAWTYEKILKGGIEGLTDRLDKLDPDFAATVYGDQTGQTITANLRAIHTAYRHALAAGKAGVQQSREGAIAGVEAATAGVRGVRDEAKELARSGLSRAQTGLESTTADLLRAIALGPTTFWGAFSIGRLLKGPRVADLMRWAAYSSPNTQRLVKAFTSPVPGQALADLIRSADIPGLTRTDTDADAPPTVGAPPPKP